MARQDRPMIRSPTSAKDGHMDQVASPGTSSASLSTSSTPTFYIANSATYPVSLSVPDRHASPNAADTITTPSSIHRSEPFPSHTSSIPAPRPQAIPISFLVHPTHVSPQMLSSHSVFNSSPKSSPGPSESHLSHASKWDISPLNSTNVLRSSPYLECPQPPDLKLPSQETPASQMAVHRSIRIEATSVSSLVQAQTQRDYDSSTQGALIKHTSKAKAPLHSPALPPKKLSASKPCSFASSAEGSKGHSNSSADSTLGMTEGKYVSDHSKDGEGPVARQISIRRTNNPNLKTTKTGKILHRSKKAGVNRRSTAYNRFLKQRSKYHAKHHPDLTAQQRMKLIAEEWAVSDKNQHKTRRRSRFLGPDGELHLPLISSQNCTTETGNESPMKTQPASSATSSSTPYNEASSSRSFSQMNIGPVSQSEGFQQLPASSDSGDKRAL